VREDFQILDRNRPQTVSAFEEISRRRADASVTGSTVKLDVADNSTARSDRLIVLVLDGLHFQGKTELVKATAARVVTELGPHASLALVTTSGTFSVEPTEDRALMLAAIQEFVDKFDPEGRRLVKGLAGSTVPRIRNSNDPGDLAMFFCSHYADKDT
jgi:hypothetical protein